MLPARLKKLMDLYQEGIISGTELQELNEALTPESLEERYNEDIIQVFMNPAGQIDEERDALIRSAIPALVQQPASGRSTHRVQKSPGASLDSPLLQRRSILKMAWFKYAAAIIIIFGIGAYLWNTQQKENPASTDEASAKAVKNEIPPGYDRAVLTLSNGQQVQLNNATSETINDGTLSIENSNGQLIYDHPERGSLSPAGGSGATGAEGGSSAGRTATNTMSTPNGGQYKLTLSDGTKVWLNAASSITYPTAFNEKIRTVTITGEAYFEVKKDPSKPFIVKTPGEQITVLGTHFNVNAYPDEESVKISLLEGSVKVANAVLKPGQAYTSGKVVRTNPDQDIAWKNGVFNFDNVTVQQAMRQMARWYNIRVVFDKPVDEVFIGKMGRGLTLQQVLKGLDGAGVHFRLEGDTLHVFP